MEFVFAIAAFFGIVLAAVLEFFLRRVIGQLARDENGKPNRRRELFLGRIVFGVWVVVVLAAAISIFIAVEFATDALPVFIGVPVIAIALASGLARGKSVFDTSADPEPAARTADRLHQQRTYEAQRDRDRKFGGF